MAAKDGETGMGQDTQAKRLHVTYAENVMSAQMLEVSLLGVGTVLRPERNAWSMAQ